jgi:hypothetical protein
MLVMDLQSITRKQFFKLKEKNLLFITNPGRMGDEDGTTFIIKKGLKCIPYRIDGWMYGPKDGKEYISIDEVFRVFPKWKEAWFNVNAEDRSADKYNYIDMGFGNGLCVDKRIYDKFESYLKKACEEFAEAEGIDPEHPGVAYNAWYDAVISMGIINKKYLKEWVYEPNVDEVKDDEKEYIYVSVVYLDDIAANTTGKPSFYYKTDKEDISIDDIVLVDRRGEEVEGRVVDIEKYTEYEAPFPVERTKDIIEVLGKYEKEEEKKEENINAWFDDLLTKEEYKKFYESIIHAEDPLLSIIPLSFPLDYKTLPKEHRIERAYRGGLRTLHHSIEEILNTKRMTQKKFDSLHKKMLGLLNVCSFKIFTFEEMIMWINMCFVNLILIDNKSADKLSKFIHIPVDNDILKEVGYRKKAWLKNGDYSGYLEFQKWYREVYDKEDY